MESSTRIIAIIDVETTGTVVERDQIIEFAVQKGFEAEAFNRSWRIKPTIPIPPAATAVHGITNEDVAECPPFSALAPTIRKILENSDVLIGYNVEFDLRMLQAEFRRLREDLDLGQKLIVDPLEIWRRCEPRKLVDAHRRFVGEELQGAHSAAVDVAATARVLQGMLRHFKLDGLDWQELVEFSNPDRKAWLGPSSHFLWLEDQVVVGFGKYRGVPLRQVLTEDRSYLPWILSQNFLPHVKEIARAAVDKSADEFTSWIATRYGRSRSAVSV